MTTCNIDEGMLYCKNLTYYSAYEDALYELFCSVYESGSICFRQVEVKMKHYPPDYDERSGFYHLICENYDEKDESSRLPNLRRCERIKWPKYIIENCEESKCKDLLVWPNTRKGKKNILLYCVSLDYLVVLGVRNGYYLLTTAYPVTRYDTRKGLLKEYAKYKQMTLPSQ